ncbi:hypothetical protein F5Y18DRAFT_429154 [Xylariaceae sp. FL1019]|nr:hypothetical protein F5Y18DRAFT_429154 [Xylariaceae sp. FL1019]
MPQLTKWDKRKIRYAPFDQWFFKPPGGYDTPVNAYVFIDNLFDAALFAHQIMQDHPSLAHIPRLVIYTDGSKLDDGSGGFAIYFRVFGVPNGPFSRWTTWQVAASGVVGTSSRGAELLAVNLAVETVLEELGDAAAHLRLFILSDCHDVLKMIRTYLAGAPTSDLPGIPTAEVSRLLRPIRALQRKGIKAEFRWSPGHNGIDGNTMADRNARKAATCVERLSGWTTTSSRMYRLIVVDQWMANEHLFKRELDRREDRDPESITDHNPNNIPLGPRVRKSVETDDEEAPAAKRRKIAEDVASKALDHHLGLPPSMANRTRASSAPPSMRKLLALELDDTGLAEPGKRERQGSAPPDF